MLQQTEIKTGTIYERWFPPQDVGRGWVEGLGRTWRVEGRRFVCPDETNRKDLTLTYFGKTLLGRGRKGERRKKDWRSRRET